MLGKVDCDIGKLSREHRIQSVDNFNDSVDLLTDEGFLIGKPVANRPSEVETQGLLLFQVSSTTDRNLRSKDICLSTDLVMMISFARKC